MKRSRLVLVILLGLILVITPLLGACGEEVTPPAEEEEEEAPPAEEEEAPPTKPEVLLFATFRPPTDPQSEAWIKPMLQEIEERTNGQVEFVVYWSEALGASKDQYTLVKDGVADMTDFAGSWVPGKFVLSDVGNLPLAAQDPAKLIEAMTILQEEGYFDTQWDEVEWLSWNCTTAYKFLFRTIKPTTYGELTGLKARTPGGVMTDYLTGVGMVPVTVLPGDAYTAWQTGLVDVWVHPPGAVVKYKFNELPTKALLDASLFCTVNAATIFNKAKFASLPSDVQETIRDVVQEYALVYLQSGLETDNTALDVMAAAGIEVYTWSDAELAKLTAAALPIWEKYISDLEDADLPGEELVSRFIEVLESLGEKPPSLP